MAKKNKAKRSAASKNIASADDQQCEPAKPGLANNTISANQSIETIMDNKQDGSRPQNGRQESLSDTLVNDLYTEVADSFYRGDLGGVSVVDPRNQNGGNQANRSSKSTGATPDGQMGYDRIREHGKDLDATQGAHPDRALSATFSKPEQGRGDAHQTSFHPGTPDLGNINTSGRYNSGNPYLDWFGRRSDLFLGGGSMIRDPIIRDIRDWSGPDQRSSTLQGPVAPYIHPEVDLAKGTNESISREWTLSPTQPHKGRPSNACDVNSGDHENDGWASGITHHEEGLETWRSAPKEADGDSGESTLALGDTADGACKKPQQEKAIERVITRDGITFGKNIQEDGNSRPGGWDWPTDNGDGSQDGGDPFTNTTVADNNRPGKQDKPEDLNSWSDHIAPMRVNRGFFRRASLDLDPTFKVEEPENSPSDFNWKIENHPWPPVRPYVESSRHKGKESTKPKDGVNPFWEPDYIEIDDFAPAVNQKEDSRVKNDSFGRREDFPPSRPGRMPNNTDCFPKEDVWATTDNLNRPENIYSRRPFMSLSKTTKSSTEDQDTKADDLNRPENIWTRRPFMSLSKTTESSSEDQDTKAEIARISKELEALKSTTRRTNKKMDNLALQFKEQKKTVEVTNEAAGDAPYWEHEDYYSYTSPLWAILLGASACFCLGMMFASGIRGGSTCIFNGAA